MSTRKQIGLLVFAVVVCGIAVAAQQAGEKPHPVFAGLKVGDAVWITEGITGFEIYRVHALDKPSERGFEYSREAFYLPPGSGGVPAGTEFAETASEQRGLRYMRIHDYAKIIALGPNYIVVRHPRNDAGFKNSSPRWRAGPDGWRSGLANTRVIPVSSIAFQGLHR